MVDELLRGKIRIEPLGPAYHLRSAAEALFRYHPDYYFLIDRDHLDDDQVERSWRQFPDPESANLLIWRRREIESYFLIPEYVARSRYLSASGDELAQVILERSRARLYIDAANLVVIAIREEQKANWIRPFTDVAEFQTRQEALERLLAVDAFAERHAIVAQTMTSATVTEKFEAVVERMTGGTEPLQFGCGDWLAMLKGKEILGQVANSHCFTVRDGRKKTLRGHKKLVVIARELVRQPIEDQPHDPPVRNVDAASRRVLSARGAGRGHLRADQRTPCPRRTIDSNCSHPFHRRI